jgi:CheY-like chemotaxis protein
MLNNVLTTLGYVVLVAETGADALRIVPGFRPDVVLLDMSLPGIPGEIVLDCLHAADACASPEPRPTRS